jgi:hypothetical protein
MEIQQSSSHNDFNGSVPVVLKQYSKTFFAKRGTEGRMEEIT